MLTNEVHLLTNEVYQALSAWWASQSKPAFALFVGFLWVQEQLPSCAARKYLELMKRRLGVVTLKAQTFQHLGLRKTYGFNFYF